MRLLHTLPVLFLAAGSACAQSAPGEIKLGERALYHVKAVAGPGAVGTLFVAGLSQWRDTPPEWGQGMEGYGRRYGYLTLDRATKNAILFGAGAMLKEDPRYFPSQEKTTGRRVRYAIVNTFRVPKEGGGTKIYYSRFLSAYGSGFLGNLYYPGRINGPGDAMLRGTYGIGGSVAVNLLNEFWPDVKKRLLRKKKR